MNTTLATSFTPPTKRPHDGCERTRCRSRGHAVTGATRRSHQAGDGRCTKAKEGPPGGSDSLSFSESESGFAGGPVGLLEVTVLSFSFT